MKSSRRGAECASDRPQGTSFEQRFGRRQAIFDVKGATFSVSGSLAQALDWVRVRLHASVVRIGVVWRRAAKAAAVGAKEWKVARLETTSDADRHRSESGRISRSPTAVGRTDKYWYSSGTNTSQRAT